MAKKDEAKAKADKEAAEAKAAQAVADKEAKEAEEAQAVADKEAEEAAAAAKEAEDAAEEPVLMREIVTVKDGGSVTTKAGIKVHGDEITEDMIAGGATVIKNLLKSKLFVIIGIEAD